MKRLVRCVDKEGFEDQLTLNRLYQVRIEGKNGPQIINDRGVRRYYGAGKFKPV